MRTQLPCDRTLGLEGDAGPPSHHDYNDYCYSYCYCYCCCDYYSYYYYSYYYHNLTLAPSLCRRLALRRLNTHLRTLFRGMTLLVGGPGAVYDVIRPKRKARATMQ